jgi:rhodanese-related sulfurtransferase
METHISARLVRLLGADGVIPNTAYADRGPDVVVCSAIEAGRLRPTREGIVIALRDPGSKPAPLKSGWGALLALEVSDVDVRGELAPSVNLEPIAEAIAEFAICHRDARTIVLHCHHGVSRSRSTAAAICEAFEWPYRWTVLHEPLYHAVLLALRRRPI